MVQGSLEFPKPFSFLSFWKYGEPQDQKDFHNNIEAFFSFSLSFSHKYTEEFSRGHYPDMVPAPKELTDLTRHDGEVGLWRDLWKGHWLGRSQEPWALLTAPLPMSWETLGKSLIFFGPHL